MIKVWYFCIAFSAWALGELVCPQSQWAYYKYRDKDIYTLNISVGGISLIREIKYTCETPENVNLRTTYFISDTNQNWNCKKLSNIECRRNCTSKSEIVKVICERSYYAPRTGSTTQTIKNCDNLFWTTWSSTTNCSSSRSSLHTRKCVDCDYDVVDSHYCKGNASKTVSCQPSWSNWKDIGSCYPIATCDLIGKQRRERKCIYGDGNVEIETNLCSKEATTSTRLCDTAITTVDGTNTSNAVTGLSIGLALSVVANIAFCFFLYLKQRPKIEPQAIANEASDPSPYELALPGSSSVLDPSREEGIYNKAMNYTTAETTYSTLNRK